MKRSKDAHRIAVIALLAAFPIVYGVQGLVTSAYATHEPADKIHNGDGIFNDPDDGKVVFCNRAFRVSAPVSVISLFQNTRAANGVEPAKLANDAAF
jgi:hypothetical protein